MDGKINEVPTDQNRDWIVNFEENFKKFESDQKDKQPKKRENTNIYKIRADIRKNFDDLYAPRKVSFGPYHHDRPSCKSTEAIKERIVCQSLVTSKKTIHDYVNALREGLKDLKDKYDDLDPKWKQDDEAFLRLMIYDGCFLLEIVNEANRLFSVYLPGWDNPIWDIDGISPNKLMDDYRQDMVLLENQLPMLVLQKLFAVQIDKPFEEAKDHLPWLMLKFFFEWLWFARESYMDDMSHALQLYRHGLLYGEQNRGNTFWPDYAICFPAISNLKISLSRRIRYLKESLPCLQTSSATDSDSSFSSADPDFSFPSATELHNVGIRFTTSKTRNLTDISFKGRTLRLPRIRVDNGTKSMFLNVIAFERSSPNQEVSWYIYLMSMLIQGVDDVRLLQSRGIIDIMLISTNEVAELFNTLTKVIVLYPEDMLTLNVYYYVATTTRECYNKMSKEWRRELRQNYLKSPWAIVSVIAAFLILGLTALQTVYSVLGYYNPK